MHVFPKEALVNTPCETMLDGECPVSVRINTPDSVPRIRDFYGKRLFNLEIEGELINDINLIRAIESNRVRVKLGDIDILEVEGRLIEALQKVRAQPVFEINPDKNLLKNINFLTSLNILVHINMSYPVQDDKVLLQTVDFYLHNPMLRIPIEPLHSLLVTMSRGRGRRLWNTELESVKTNFFVSDQGEVSLSKRWIENGMKYGTLDDSVNDFMKSELYNKLAMLRENMFRSKSPCAFCRHLDVCKGFLRAIDPEWPCDIWKKVFSILQSTVREGEDLLRKIDQQRQQAEPRDEKAT